VLLTAFVLVQIFKPDTATVPPRIMKQRSIIAGFWATFAIGSQMMIVIYFLPIWFQAIKGVNAVDSGIRLLPMLLPMVFASIATGIVVNKTGYYTPPMILGNCVMAVGCGLLTTLQVDSKDGIWIGYQVVYGIGLGCTFQAPNLAAQTVLSHRDVPVGTSLMFFSQLLGGAIFTSVGQTVFNTELLKRLSHIPGFDPELLLSTGATTLIQELPDSVRPTVLAGYNDSLRKVFEVALIMACLVIFGSLGLEWRSVKKNAPKKGGDAASKVEEGKAKEMVDGGRETDLDEGKRVSAEKGEESTTLGDDERSRAEDMDKETERKETPVAAPTVEKV
jgi:MFS family permease